MQKSFITKIALALTILFATQLTTNASANEAATGSFKSMVKSSVQYVAGGVAIGGLVYGGYELCQAISHWVQTNNDNPHDKHIEERNKSLMKMLAALAVAATSGVICYADVNAFIVNFDIVGAARLGYDIYNGH